MPEQLQTRTEYSRSLQDGEKFRAIETLKKVGLLIPVADLETFHGRVGNAEEDSDWVVDPSFANGGNDSGNSNFNNRPTLYTGEKELAQDFAKIRQNQIVRARYDKIFEERVTNYSPEERQQWLDRENKRHQDWYAGIRPANKPAYAFLLDDRGSLKPKGFDDLKVPREARRLEQETPAEEKNKLWNDIASKLKVEIHEIVTADLDATVIDEDFDETKLESEAQVRYRAALKALAIPVTEGSPVKFSHRDKVEPFVLAMSQIKGPVLSSSDVQELAAKADVGEIVALQLASAFNARVIALWRPTRLVNDMLKSSTDIFLDSIEVNDESLEVPVNLEYAGRYLREAHVVGIKQRVHSATLGREITSVSFLDLEKTSTREGLEAGRQDTWRKLGNMATVLSRIESAEVQPRPSLGNLLTDVHVKPAALVAAAKAVEGYRAIFDGDNGNWEGFSLAQHTETVLRNFDENFAEDLPVELLAPMRMAILVHDIGKPIAAARGEKHKQMQYNLEYADDFLDKVGVGDELKGLLLAIIGEGEDLAFQIEVKGAGDSATFALRELAIKTLKRLQDSENVTDGQIIGFIEMCKMLQVCDGGAYTSMAITDLGGIKGRHRNSPSFNESFAQPFGFGKRTIRLRGAADKSAAADLTPYTGNDTPRI